MSWQCSNCGAVYADEGRSGEWATPDKCRCGSCLFQKIHDPVNHPKHYTSHPSGIECIQVTEHMNFNIGNAVKYLWRADMKNGLEDLKKAAWYVNREIERQGKEK